MLTFKEIPKTNTSIIYTSSFNYQEDIIYFLNNNCEVITKDNKATLKEVAIPLLKQFNLTNLLIKNKLTKIDELKIKVLSSLENSKDIYVFFNILTFLDNDFKSQVINFLKDKDKIIINYTKDIEETLLLENLIVINNNEIVLEGKTQAVLKEEKILKTLGLNIPFIVDLSIGLKYYNLVDKIYFDNESLVEKLWK